MTFVSMPYSNVGTMQSTTQMTVTQNGLAPGKENGASVATRAASGSETNETFSAMFDPTEISRTSPVDCLV